MYTDASLSGWGAYCSGESTCDWWSQKFKGDHINLLELQAIFFGLECFAKGLRNTNILIRTDNTTALSYINRMGSVQFPKLNSLSRQIWQWCEARNLWVFASYVSSKENQNHKCDRYVAWLRDPGAEVVDAFTVDWAPHYFDAFLSFALTLRAVQKITTIKQPVSLQYHWQEQPWYPLFMELVVGVPLIYNSSLNLLFSLYSTDRHPLAESLTLVAAKLSGRRSH
ncbi:hypothetical protein NQ315_003197 [Exocentrus adspersus]|uniref:RNase H type-1 domain-containing protein n=1 Tax=Exocentrus adspersus TaxID=1586481 RepID=A0AAV8VM60_9CUCU|nr:hypothetical protein NQ315_003197 [Exocentrus adspersus]